MPDIALLTSTVPTAAPPAADTATTETAQLKKQSVKVEELIVQAAKEHQRAGELCRAIQQWLDREEKARKRAEEQSWLPSFGPLLDFPGATGLDTPFFLFLENLRFGSLGISPPYHHHRQDTHALDHPLMSALYGPSGPLRPLETLKLPDLNHQRMKRIMNWLRDQLEPDFIDMPLRQFMSDGHRQLQALVSYVQRIRPNLNYDTYDITICFSILRNVLEHASKGRALDRGFSSGSERLAVHGVIPRVLQKDVTEDVHDCAQADLVGGLEQSARKSKKIAGSKGPGDQAVLAGAAKLFLESNADSYRNALFMDGQKYVLTEYLPLFSAPGVGRSNSSRSTTPVKGDDPSAVSDVSSSATSFSRCPPFLPSLTVKTGCAAYLHLVGEPTTLDSPDLFWSLFACFGTTDSNSPFSSFEIIKGSAAGEELLKTIELAGLSFSPPASKATGESDGLPRVPVVTARQAEGEAPPDEDLQKGSADTEAPDEKQILERQVEVRAEALFPLEVVTNIAVHFSGSPTCHHLLTPLHVESASPSPPDPLLLTIDSKHLGHTYKATVFSAKTSTGATLVIKYSQTDEFVQEGKVLSELNRLDPEVTPKCYGTFDGEGPMKGYRALLLEHGGETVKSFYGLPKEDRQAILNVLERAHQAGYTQGSFYERNVVRDAAGRYRLIDFERADRHKCPGKLECYELKKARRSLRL
ncbi:hypothetical protein JCM11251_006943 [Rhodosporidiobolus azoricus]